MKYLIYIAYSPNLIKERFIAYIKGGYFEKNIM